VRESERGGTDRVCVLDESEVSLRKKKMRFFIKDKKIRSGVKPMKKICLKKTKLVLNSLTGRNLIVMQTQIEISALILGPLEPTFNKPHPSNSWINKTLFN